MRRIVLLLSLSLQLNAFVALHAQTDLNLDALYAIVKSPYAGLDTSMAKISTGYLADKAVDLVKLPLFGGSALCDTNYVDLSTFRDLFRTMNYARVNGAASEYDADSIYATLSSSPYVKLGSALFKYNRIRGDAIVNGLIEYNSGSGSFSDRYVGGAWQNPYKTEYVFMFTTSRYTCESYEVTFDISDLTSWCNASISNVLIDFGDGLGYVSPGVSSTRQIQYASSGEKELKLKIRLPDNMELESHTRINIKSHSANMTMEPSVVDSTFTISAGGVSAVCSIKYNVAHGRSAIRPLIYVEGFDHPVLCELGRVDGNSVTDYMSSVHSAIQNVLAGNCEGNYNFTDFYRGDISLTNYDSFYVNWNNPEADINLNAQLLKEVIRTVNACKPSDGSGGRTVIVGHSMGGLIARVALRQMELDGEPHQVGCFVSQDSPHYGANVPIGVQYSIRDVYRAFFGSSGNSGLGLIPDVKTFFDKVVGVLDCTSARQMMYNYVNSSGVIDNSVHQQWQSYLNTIGYPQGDAGQIIENLTIVSGNELDATDLSQKILSFGLFFIDLKMLLKHSIPAALSMDVQIDRDRQAGTLVSKTILSYNVHSEALHMNIAIPIMYREHYSPGNIGHYDTVPGSYLEFDFPTDTWLLNNPFLNLNVGEKVLFVPSASSFAVENYSADFFNDFSSYESSSPFGSFCLEQQAQRHDRDLDNYIGWIDNYDQIVINSPQVVFTGDVVSVSNNPSDVTNEEILSLSSSNAVINANSGEVTVINPGLVTFKYKADPLSINNGLKKIYRKRRRVLAGFPSMSLYKEYIGNDYYTFTAECTSTDNELRSKLDELAATGEIKYVWGHDDSTGSMVWTDTTSTRSYSFLAPNGRISHCYFRMLSSSGRVSQVNVCEIDRTYVDSFYHDPVQIEINSPGFLLLDYNHQLGTSIMSNGYFVVWKNSSFSPSPPAPDNILVGNESIPLEYSAQKTIDGESVTVYCFEFQSSNTVQQLSSQPPSPFGPLLLPVKIRNGTTVLQTINFPVIN